MKFRHWLLCLGFAFGLTAGVAGQVWELDPSLSLGYSNSPGTNNGFTLSSRLDGLLTVPFDQAGSGFDVKAHVEGDIPAEALADFDVLSVTLAYPNPGFDLKSLKWTLGRFSLTEPTGLLLNHPGDGFKLDFKYDSLDLAIAAGYTGFVFRTSSDMALTLEDLAHSGDLFATRRIIGSVEGGMDLFGSHRFTLSFLAQQDMNPGSDMNSPYTEVFSSSKGGTLDTQYWTLKASGPVTDLLYYEAFGTLGTGSTLSWVSDPGSSTFYSYQYKPIVSGLLGGSMSYFIPSWMSAAFTGRILIASGDTHATSVVEGNTQNTSTLFVPLTTTTLGVVFNPGLSNLVYYELGGSLKPVADLPVVVGTKLLGFQRAVYNGVVNASGVLQNGPYWMGEELDFTASWPVYTDFTLTAQAGGFFPSSGTYAPGAVGDGFQYAVRIGGSMSL